jgi:hypothetical protein
MLFLEDGNTISAEFTGLLVLALLIRIGQKVEFTTDAAIPLFRAIRSGSDKRALVLGHFKDPLISERLSFEI